MQEKQSGFDCGHGSKNQDLVEDGRLTSLVVDLLCMFRGQAGSPGAMTHSHFGIVWIGKPATAM